MRRLIYSPKVQAWISGTEGVVDVSPYIVSGSIQRKVNQVSNASLVLRNPVSQTGDYVGTLFTDFRRSDGSIGPLFHPMDPIIVTMQRLEGHPVQVFTGYLDKSPYLQLYPGLCQIDASCTLKRLLYTQFDAALPFVQYFLSLFGWVPDGNSGILNPTAETDKLKISAGQIQSQFNDGSLGGLLYAVMLYIGNWDASTIFIEKLPDNIRTYVVNLFNRLQSNINQDESIFQSLIEQILGTNSLGTGNANGNTPITPTGPLSNQQIMQTIKPVAAQYGVPLQMILAVMYIESSMGSNMHTPGSQYYGWFQTNTNAAPYNYGTWSKTPPTITEAENLGQAIVAFCSAAQGYANANPSLKNDIHQWAMSTQGVNCSNNPYYCSGWAAATANANGIISQFGSTTGTSQANTNNVSTAPSNPYNASGGRNMAQAVGTSPGGKTGTTKASQATNSNGVINPIPGWTIGREDMGVDATAPAGTAVLAPAACSYVQQPIPGWYPYLYLFKFDQTPPGAPSDYWYVAEGVTAPTKTHYNQGDVVVTSDPSQPTHSIEIGWGSATTNSRTLDGGANANPSPGAQTPYGTSFKNYFSIGGGSPVQGGQTSGTGTTGGSGTNSATAAAFSTMINLPSVFQTAEAVAFTGKRSFIADSPLFPFIEQLCQASLRCFMSMPNGNFFAFFPDYFGLFGRQYYWQISDIEIVDGRIDLSDDPLTTHVAIAGDVTQFSGTVDVFDLLLTAGIFDIFDAFALGYVTGPDTLVNSDLTVSGEINPNATNPSAKTPASNRERLASTNDALAFLQKYGARTYVEEIPAIRSPFFELFYAFMKFMLLWSKQFQTTFELTFMPELFPGGLVGFPDHNLQLYVEEVTHTFDYTNGFQTIANFSSPARLNNQGRANLREGLTRIAPTQYPTVTNAAVTLQSKAQQLATQTVEQVNSIAANIGKF